MPHLQIDVNIPLSDVCRKEIATSLKRLFSEIMETETGHIAVAIREHGTFSLDIGRVSDHSAGVAHVNADIREGRSREKRRQLALGFIDALHKTAGIPKKHIYVTFTEHKGEDFHLHERHLRSWHPGEDPLS